MGQYLPVSSFFRAVYLIDFSPSLCEVARARFRRLGWKNVTVVCQDARYFRLEDYEDHEVFNDSSDREKRIYGMANSSDLGADVITMSYALSMIPEYYPVIDSLSALLAADGLLGVVDFYVQSQVDFRSKNYTGGIIDRHCNWWSRTFWRTWFEASNISGSASCLLSRLTV
jgi:betaine lipid synthase